MLSLLILICISCLPEEEEGQSTLKGSSLGKSALFDPFSSVAPKMPSAFYHYPGFTHEIRDFKKEGRGFTLEDGSRYTVAYADLGRFLSWEIGDNIVFFLCDEWFSFYQLRAYNLTHHAEVKVNLEEEPLHTHPLAKKVEGIDPEKLFLRLTDGSFWNIWEGDQENFSEWKIGDLILVGCSHSAFGEALLYNTSLNQSQRKYSLGSYVGF